MTFVILKRWRKNKNLSVVYQLILRFCLLLLKCGLQAENWFIILLKISMTFSRRISSYNFYRERKNWFKVEGLWRKGIWSFLNDPPCHPIMENPEDPSIMNKYMCFVTNYFCFYCVRVTNVQIHTLNEKNLMFFTILHR